MIATGKESILTIYSVNKGIGWASSGVEYAQAYRSNIFKKNGQQAKFIFTDIFHENLEPMTKNLGFEDKDIIWLYQYFTDIKVSPTTYKMEELVKTFATPPTKIEETESKITYFFEDTETVVHAFLDRFSLDKNVFKTETIVQNKLIQRDYYSYVKVFSEYFKDFNNQINIYQRRFFNEDGTIAYDEIMNGKQNLFILGDRTIYSLENFLGYFISCLNLTTEDIILIDRATNIGPAILKHKGPAKLGVVIHAEHFSESFTNDKNILWNNYYDYQLKNAEVIDFFICATDLQKHILEKQFLQYKKGTIKIYAIPVGSIDRVTKKSQRKLHSLVTASRLANEKHLDWLIESVVNVKKTIKDLSLDIYGEGVERQYLEQLIHKYQAQKYICLKGQQDLSNVYEKYESYVSTSTSEGFGLSLLEAIGSGLAMIGFNVNYGNPTFINHEENGYLVEYIKNDKITNIVRLSDAILNFCNLEEEQKKKFEKESYKIARKFSTNNVKKMWLDLERDITID